MVTIFDYLRHSTLTQVNRVKIKIKMNLPTGLKGHHENTSDQELRKKPPLYVSVADLSNVIEGAIDIDFLEVLTLTLN